MNEFSAAIGRIQLKKLDKMNQKRNSIAKIYSEELKITKMLYFLIKLVNNIKTCQK